MNVNMWVKKAPHLYYTSAWRQGIHVAMSYMPLILTYQGVHHCPKGITDCQGSDTTWEFKMYGTVLL